MSEAVLNELGIKQTRKRCGLCGQWTSEEIAFFEAPDHPYCCEKHGYILLCPKCWSNMEWDTEDSRCLKLQYKERHEK